jgi:hypothetical protein
MAERDELRDYRYSEGEIRSSDWLKGFGPVGCDAEGIASRVGPFVIERADIEALVASGMAQPTEADWLAWLIARCDDELRVTSSAVGTPHGRSEAEARKLWEKPNSSAQDGFWFPSAHTLQRVRHVIALAFGFWPEFAECPKPKEIDGLSAGETEGILQDILSWARSRWQQIGGTNRHVGEKSPQADAASTIPADYLIKGAAVNCFERHGVPESTAYKRLQDPAKYGIRTVLFQDKPGKQAQAYHKADIKRVAADHNANSEKQH